MRQTNSLGLSDIEWSIQKPEGNCRIIALGDSFTEGVGAPDDSSWVKLMEGILNESNLRKFELLNAGVSGSDPYFAKHLLEKKLLPYQPDIVLFSISYQDFVEDIASRGGAERFYQNDGTHPLAFKELIYAYSHLSRIYFEIIRGYNELLINPEKDSFIDELAEEKIPEMAAYFSEFFKTNPGIEAHFILYPHKVDLFPGRYEKLRISLVSNFKKNGLNLIDLFDCYRNYFAQNNVKHEDYWWRFDGHHNSRGYLLKANCIYNELFLKNPQFSQNCLE